MTVQDRPCLPVGAYVGRFVGTAHQDTSGANWKPAIGNDGQPMPPGLIWSWEITEGPHAGSIADRMTGKVPTPASTCGAMLSALVEKPIAVGEEIDLDKLVGTLWRFHVERKERGNGTCVAFRGLLRARDLEPRPGVNGTARTVAHLAPPPPDDEPEAELPENGDGPMWWVKRSRGSTAECVDLAGLKEFVRGGADPKKDKCCPVGLKKWVPIAVAVPELAELRPIL